MHADRLPQPLQPLRRPLDLGDAGQKGEHAALRLAQRLPGLRMLPGRFMEINQAMGMTKGKPAAIAYLRSFVEEMKASGFVAEALKRHGVEGVSVAPAAAH